MVLTSVNIFTRLRKDNILISSNEAPLLTDFGMSHMLTGASILEAATCGVKGTIRWLAPEIINSQDPEDVLHTEASDVWALGMVYLVRAN